LYLWSAKKRFKEKKISAKMKVFNEELIYILAKYNYNYNLASLNDDISGEITIHHNKNYNEKIVITNSYGRKIKCYSTNENLKADLEKLTMYF